MREPCSNPRPHDGDNGCPGSTDPRFPVPPQPPSVPPSPSVSSLEPGVGVAWGKRYEIRPGGKRYHRVVWKSPVWVLECTGSRATREYDPGYRTVTCEKCLKLGAPV